MADSTQQRAQVRADRLKRLKDAADKYIASEKDRIDTEVAVLQGVLDGRRSGQGTSQDATGAVSKLAAADLAWFLRGY